jgi:hypothetical protein
MELGSLKGDSFTVSNSDAKTLKWDIFEVLQCADATHAIASGVLTLATVTAEGNCRSSVQTSSTISGDFDLRVKIDIITDTGVTSHFLDIFNAKNNRCSSTADGVFFLNQDGILQTHKCVNGGTTQVGTNTAFATDPFWFRVVRLTNTYTTYYSMDGSAWTQDETFTDAGVAGAMYIHLEEAAAVSGTAVSNYDDFHLASGTVDAGGYRTSGSWTSPSLSFGGSQRIQRMTLDYSGASATGYVDSISVTDAAGTALFTDSLDLTSGTTRTYDIPDLGPSVVGDTRFRVVLAGDGSATPVLEAITVEWGPRGGTTPTVDAPDALAVILLFLVPAPLIALWVLIEKRRRIRRFG